MLGLLSECCGKCDLSGCKSRREASSVRAQSITRGGEHLKRGGGKHQPKGSSTEACGTDLCSWPMSTEVRGWDAMHRITRVNIYS